MPANIQPSLTRPFDFDRFWEKTLAEINGTPFGIHREIIERREPGLVLERVSFLSLGGVRVTGYAIGPASGSPGPLVVHGHGYGSQVEFMWSWALRGLRVLGVDIRGFGLSADALPNPSPRGYVLTGKHSPETSVLRAAVCDTIRAVQVAREFFGSAVSRTVLHGISFAGGLALMAQGVLQEADLLALGVPTFGWAEGRKFFVKLGSGSEINRYLEEHPDEEEDLMVVLRYFDPLNFAGSVRCPALVGLGLEDEVVPAYTVYAIANHLAGPREIMTFPVSHTQLPEEKLWDHFENRWIDLALNGIPDDFGAAGESINITQ